MDDDFLNDMADPEYFEAKYGESAAEDIFGEKDNVDNVVGGNDMQGLFGNMFDLNHDGKLDNAERAADLAAFTTMMDEDERRAALEDAGLDPDDYEF